MSRVLVVYYSRTGRTEKVAEHLADRSGADIEAIGESQGRLGFFGYFRSAREALKRKHAAITPMLHDLGDYDIVLLGTPVWAGHVSSPMRACLDANKETFRRVAFFCTQHGSGAEKVLQEMAEICGRQPEATLIVNDPEIKQCSYGPKLDQFIHAIGLPIAD
jgi:flavodoxin